MATWGASDSLLSDTVHVINHLQHEFRAASFRSHLMKKWVDEEIRSWNGVRFTDKCWRREITSTTRKLFVGELVHDIR